MEYVSLITNIVPTPVPGSSSVILIPIDKMDMAREVVIVEENNDNGSSYM